MNPKQPVANIPAIELPLKGRALIEASAGTGKTWTLTGIILRLLIEERRPAKEIVASTFTRAAAAEMRQRIQARVQDFRQLLITILLAAKDDIDLLNDDEQLFARLDAYLTQQNIVLYCQDDVNRHLIRQLVRQDGLTGLLSAYRLTELALAELNKLFVGTLDSLCQRWLREFATETGMSEHVTINEDSEALTMIIHQQLRRIQHDYIKQSPLHKEVIANSDSKLTDLHAHIKAIMAFGRVPIHSIKDVGFDEAKYQQAHQALLAVSDEEITETLNFLEDNLDVLHKGRALYKHKQAIPLLNTQLKGLQTLEGSTASLMQAISDMFKQDSTSSFTKKGEHLREPFKALTLIKRLYEFHCWQQLAEKQKAQYQDAILEQIALEVRKKLPHTLESRGEGMFSLQLERLNRVLEGEYGELLARYIAHRYPVMLVDESQDLNHEQAKMLESIYLRKENHDGFLLLVGDPKQAIYGFRGGDVANYNRLKKQFDEPNTLTINRRSSPSLVNALNEFYLPVGEGSDQTNGQQSVNSAKLGDGIYYQMMSAVEKDSREVAEINHSIIEQPAIWYTFDKADEDFAYIVDIIQALTTEKSRYFRLKDGQHYKIRYQDIMVLLPSHAKLQGLQQQLLAHGINAQLKADNSVFSNVVAQEFAYLLSLMLDPYHDGYMRRLLTGELFRFEPAYVANSNIDNMHQDDNQLTHYRQLFIAAGQTWQQHGLLRAVQDILTSEMDKDETLWTRVAGYAQPDNLRYLLDMRHCLQILVDKSRQLSPRQLHDWWLAQLANPPTAEWAQVHPLPAQDAVNLLTLHSAKGLQSPIVIVGSDVNFNRSSPYHLYHDDNEQLYLSFTAIEKAQAKAKQIKAYEKRRLLYVALTRAEDLLFIGKHNKSADSYKALYHAHYYEAGYPATIHSQSVSGEKLGQQLQTTTAQPFETEIVQHAPTKNHKSLVYKHFKGWGKSSFSALLRHHGEQQQDFKILQPDYQQEDDELETELVTVEEVTDAIQFNFPKGTNAGSFLHETLERLPEQTNQWPPFISKMLSKYQLQPDDKPDIFMDELAQWIDEIMHTPLAASGIKIHAIANKDRVRELSFNLGISDHKPMNLLGISKLFAQYNLALPLAKSTALTRFIRGEIDLVYRHAGKYYIVDYKSNYLGPNIAHYDEKSMRQTMDEHLYWLQAAIYQLALHRFLRVRLPEYQPEKHLGGVEYAFLRAMQPQYPQYGKLVWHIPFALLEQLDDILAYQESAHARIR